MSPSAPDIDGLDPYDEPKKQGKFKIIDSGMDFSITGHGTPMILTCEVAYLGLNFDVPKVPLVETL